MHDIHITREMLRAVYRGDLPPRTLAELGYKHLMGLCPPGGVSVPREERDLSSCALVSRHDMICFADAVLCRRGERGMATAHDVAAYILRKKGEMTAMKLQKLVYYSQAWSLVWDEEPLFRDRIEAWANGPVVPALYAEHRGQFKVGSWSKGNLARLTATQRQTVDAVLKYYGDRPSQWLSDLTHREAPWVEARQGLGPGERGSQVISHASMAEYYGSLL